MRLIDADALKIKLDELHWTVEYGFRERITLDDIIDNAPTIDLERQSFIEGYKNGCEEAKRCYERPVKIEITEHHTFAKPDNVSDIKFGDE